MIQHFNKEETKYILSECKKFRDEYLNLDMIKKEKELYIQLRPETNDDQGLRISFDVYTKELLNLIGNFANGVVDRFPLFSLRFDSYVLQSTHKVLLKRMVSQEMQLEDGRTTIVNNVIPEHMPVISLHDRKGRDAWFTASLCGVNDPNCTIKGELVRECGTAVAVEIGISLHGDVSSSEQRSINGIISSLNESALPLSEDITSSANGSNVATSYDVYAYRVGNANTTLIKTDIADESLLVDCGIEKIALFRKNYANAEKAITSFNPKYILISHNHLDHYNLFFKNIAVQSLALHVKNHSLLEMIIVPDDVSNNLSTKVRNKQLESKIRVINKATPNYQDILKDTFPAITIGFGNCPNKAMSVEGKQENFENDTGIIVSIENNKKVLLPGDCSYDYIPDGVKFDDADYIIIPHHGGKAMMNNIVSMKSNCKCIVSSGFKNLFGPGQAGYKKAYDQGIFLTACGVANLKKQLKFIVSRKKYYRITGI